MDQLSGYSAESQATLREGPVGDMPPALAFSSLTSQFTDMSKPVTVDIPHKLGREAAKDRLRKGLDKLASFIPGAGILDDQWDGDRLSFKVRALGQTAAATLDVFDDRVQ